MQYVFPDAVNASSYVVSDPAQVAGNQALEPAALSKQCSSQTLLCPQDFPSCIQGFVESSITSIQ